MLIRGTTEVYGIIGNPISHSLSPLMHNAAFKKLGLDSVYVPFPVRDVSLVPEAMRCFQIRGLSVTAPFKEKIIPFIDAVDESGKIIGAVNTLKYDGEKIHGINTDWMGAMRALEKKTTLEGKNCLILGAGGAARAILFGLSRSKAHSTVVNRNVDRAKNLAKIFGADFASLDDFPALEADIVINTTPVGMHPNTGESLVPPSWLNSHMLVMDIVYDPQMTKLLKEAKGSGCAIIKGFEMLLEQGVAQFEWWTGKVAPKEEMARSISFL